METEARETTDIFLWANTTDAIKNEMDVEFFLFNKNYTPYSTNFASELNAQIKPLFLYDLINFVNLGAGTGLSVRDYEVSDGEENVLLRTDLEKAQADLTISKRSHSQGELVNPKILNTQRKAIARIKTAITAAEKEGKESK